MLKTENVIWSGIKGSRDTKEPKLTSYLKVLSYFPYLRSQQDAWPSVNPAKMMWERGFQHNVFIPVA